MKRSCYLCGLLGTVTHSPKPEFEVLSDTDDLTIAFGEWEGGAEDFTYQENGALCWTFSAP